MSTSLAFYDAPSESPIDSTAVETTRDEFGFDMCLDMEGPAILSSDPKAIERRNAVDGSVKITFDMAMNDTAGRPVRVFCDGVFDLFHQGHANVLHQAKTAFPNVYLIAGINCDRDTHRIKGQTVFYEEERLEILKHIRYIDEVCICPFNFDMEFVKEMKIDFVAHDAIPYPISGEADDMYQKFRDAGVFVETKRWEGVSTTDVLHRILTDVETYIVRNIGKGKVIQDRQRS
ncbi:hypothetical protein QR680_003573 [Steinernema hermaphroditum]|uniref:choline-phosphate cytidylyltransferase n=1 Tax=Steinernema hermaphroditum TaxID=289476 RepID=A0AA39HN60_9BILA|nr:hypothetical protein QR680_003573 [Steinernema hermaphroditum]